MNSITDRAVGAIMGGFIGDALGLGCHWYYDLDEQRRDYGAWINGYTTPKPGRYHDGLKAGQLSQAGLIAKMLLESVVARKGYDQDDFTRRLDDDLFPQIDGKPAHGPGGYTSQSIREAYRRRVQEKKPWTETGGYADTTEAAERAFILSALYGGSPRELAQAVSANTTLTQIDSSVVAMTVAYCSVVGLLVSGENLDADISDKLMKLVKSGALPFHSVTGDNLQGPKPGSAEAASAGKFPSPDALLTPGYIAEAAADPDIKIEPAWKVSIVYGMPCAIYHQLPAAYYLATRFKHDFEAAVLNAINGGGQNQARAILTGALVGAQVGFSGIPSRFVDGLEDSSTLVNLAHAAGELRSAT
jgi:ADP-ribosylglycohydrolase